MGIFSRMGEIINANINAMLDRAENPSKMIKLMITEMEDTLIETKSLAAELIAERIGANRRLESAQAQAKEWEQRAALAIEKDREDLARGALEQKLSYLERVKKAKKELDELNKMIGIYQKDIVELEKKLESARQRQKSMAAAEKKHQLTQRIRKVETARNMAAFDVMQTRLDQFEGEAEAESLGRSRLESEFEALAMEGDVEAQLATLKRRRKR